MLELFLQTEPSAQLFLRLMPMVVNTKNSFIFFIDNTKLCYIMVYCTIISHEIFLPSRICTESL